MFVDASAMVAILTDEADAHLLAEKLQQARSPVTSPIAVVETVLALARKRQQSVGGLSNDVREFLTTTGIIVKEISEEIGFLALEAHDRFGKGSGHPAKLNFGDCFAYAMARQQGVRLLYKGEDFAHTDLA